MLELGRPDRAAEAAVGGQSRVVDQEPLAVQADHDHVVVGLRARSGVVGQLAHLDQGHDRVAAPHLVAQVRDRPAPVGGVAAAQAERAQAGLLCDLGQVVERDAGLPVVGALQQVREVAQLRRGDVDTEGIKHHRQRRRERYE